ncbi:methyl-accepting chemotaxis protein [Actinotalea sp.]|uniref:methyl-accepting chemotaxis protein n=1 Tax=Actinotalea sp. TaxID=1872145 RepID=UPI002BA48956|nr:methyl-accepting chemotaxis protein [Actinotalea sp.]HQY34697.1 methyl-accepting chemotaxis protein [Actinotalea sp.]HRA51815.1 methyl-accepting chemotaxis protein [Actinotalea sp.]
MRMARRTARRDEVAASAGDTLTVPHDVVRRLRGRNEDLGLATEDLAGSVERMSQATRATAEAADSASRATGRVDAGASAVASAVHEMSSAMQEVATSAAEATGVTARATEVTAEMRGSVERLAASTAQIEGVLRTVSGISDQTRMLALNATIEAARAGEAGKSFSVVAEEVKNLAAQTGEATVQIAAQLAELAADSAGVRRATDRIDEVLARVDALQQTIAAAVEQQTAAIGEITRSAADTAEAAKELDVSVETSASAARGAAEAMGRSREWIERIGASLDAQRTELEDIAHDLAVHPLRAAITAHANWKKHLRSAIDTGRLPAGLEVATARRSDACAFGKWLGSGAGAELDRARAATVIEQHAAFHRHAAEVLAAATSGRTAQAQGLFADPQAYGGAAAVLTDALVEWVHVVERA